MSLSKPRDRAGLRAPRVGPLTRARRIAKAGKAPLPKAPERVVARQGGQVYIHVHESWPLCV